jgi:SH3-like domain-containing protein
MRLRSVSAFVLLSALILIPSSHLEAASKTIIRVKGKEANIRSGPATSYKKLWTSTKYTPFEVLCKYQKWYVVRDYEGFVGWVYEPLVEKAPAVIVNVKQALARAGPGPEESAIWNVPKGYPLKVLDTQGKWYHVEDAEGEKAWIYKDVLWGSTD